MSYFHKAAAEGEDWKVKSERMLIPFGIVFHATPASKTHSTDLPACLTLSTEGKTADATAIDTGTNFSTETDATGVFGVLLHHLGTVKKLLDAQVVNLSSGTCTVARAGASTSGVTASGNIALTLDSSVNLSTTSLTGTIVVDYLISKA